jgi:hypothetical protein
MILPAELLGWSQVDRFRFIIVLGEERATMKIKRLPVQDIGLDNLAAIPYVLSLSEPLHTAFRLAMKQVDILPVQLGFTNSYTVNGVTATGFEFMYAKAAVEDISHAINRLRHALETDAEGTLKSICSPDSASRSPAYGSPPADSSPDASLSLDSPEQFAMAWTNYEGVYQLALPYLPAFVASLTDANEATRQFWPTLGEYSFPHNLIILEKIQESRVEKVKSLFGDVWTTEGMEALYSEGRLYALDLTIFECVSAPVDNARRRYTHSTFTVLRQDSRTKALEPIAIWISGKNVDGRVRIYTRAKATPGAWIFALQAVKVSITVYAIWLRHVYLWHIVPSTMQMTMHNALPAGHPIYQLLAPQSKYTIPFNEVMLLLWDLVAPPTSLTTQYQFLKVCDEFAKGRGFFDDDPKVVLKRLGLREEDFTRTTPWDGYAAVKDLLELWEATEQYVDACVDATYSDDAAVANDAGLKAWMAASSDVGEGNLRGLEPLDGRAALKRLLTSLLHRVVAHGGARIVAPTFLVHLFSPNYPICLQRRDIPEPDAELDTKQLLTYLPNIRTIGVMASFYFSFNFTKPYEPFVPPEGVEARLYFPSGLKDARNRALVAYRNALIQFINARAILPDQISQWPLNVET